MSDKVLSHNEMCRREGISLQRGMNFGLGGNHSVILMSVRPNAPYRDRLEEGGTTLIYEGHDQPKSMACLKPKVVDQPGVLPSGNLPRTESFTRLRKSLRRENVRQSEFASMKRFARGYGPTTESFISLTPGQSVMSIELCTSSNSWRWRGTRTSLNQFIWTQSVVASSQQPSSWKFGKEMGESVRSVRRRTSYTLITSFHSRRAAPHSQPRTSSFSAHVTTSRNGTTSHECKD